MPIFEYLCTRKQNYYHFKYSIIMKCPNCGKEIAEGSPICEYCGTKIDNVDPKTKKKALIVVGIVALVLVAVAAFTGGGTFTNRIDQAVDAVETGNYEIDGEDMADYVDLGLPSGTLWKNMNENYVPMTYDQVIEMFPDQIPTLDQWNELKRCGILYEQTGITITGPNGNSIFLAYSNYVDRDGDLVQDYDACYWTSSVNGEDHAYSCRFHYDELSGGEFTSSLVERSMRMGVQLVRKP